VPAARFVRQVTLRDFEMPRAQNLRGQGLDEKFSLDFPGRNVMAPAFCHVTSRNSQDADAARKA
jgi:hypothetical protein